MINVAINGSETPKNVNCSWCTKKQSFSRESKIFGTNMANWKCNCLLERWKR